MELLRNVESAKKLPSRELKYLIQKSVCVEDWLDESAKKLPSRELKCEIAEECEYVLIRMNQQRNSQAGN